MNSRKKKFKIIPTQYNIILHAVNSDGIPMAYASILIKDKKDERVGHLMGLLRHPEFKGLGICESLIKERIKLCETLGCSRIVTGVYKKRFNLINLYKSLGFKEIKSDSPNHIKLELIL